MTSPCSMPSTKCLPMDPGRRLRSAGHRANHHSANPKQLARQSGNRPGHSSLAGGECRQVKQRKTRKRKSKRSREGDGEGEAEQDEDEDEEEHRGARSGESEELAELEGRAPAPSGSKPSLRTTSYHPRSRAQRPAKATTHPMTSTDTVVPRIMTSTHTQLIAAPARRPKIPSPRHAPASRHAALTALPTSTSVTCNPGRWTA
mmetsp:Transcript_33018/g.79623  ORF Transcript_33018/g.79623 Transcript_33018/m.79623 type:complete len:203 (-) Transcript_33018:202-810(-)